MESRSGRGPVEEHGSSRGEHVDIRVLGPFEVILEGRLVEVFGRRERAVLTLLAVEVGRPVAVPRLGELLWGDAPPRTADKTLQTFVSRLRHALGDVPDRLVRRERSYLLDLPTEATDLGRFRQLVRGAAKASSTGVRTRPSTLSDRQIDVAVLAVGPLSSRAIAERLYLSRRTVDNHLGSIYRKLGLHGRDELRDLLLSSLPDGDSSI